MMKFVVFVIIIIHKKKKKKKKLSFDIPVVALHTVVLVLCETIVRFPDVSSLREYVRTRCHEHGGL